MAVDIRWVIGQVSLVSQQRLMMNDDPQSFSSFSFPRCTLVVLGSLPNESLVPLLAGGVGKGGCQGLAMKSAREKTRPLPSLSSESLSPTHTPTQCIPCHPLPFPSLLFPPPPRKGTEKGEGGQVRKKRVVGSTGKESERTSKVV